MAAEGEGERHVNSADMMRTIPKQLQFTASPRQQERSRRANQEEGSCESGSYYSAAAESDADTESTKGAVAATNTAQEAQAIERIQGEGH